MLSSLQSLQAGGSFFTTDAAGRFQQVPSQGLLTIPLSSRLSDRSFTGFAEQDSLFGGTQPQVTRFSNAACYNVFRRVCHTSRENPVQDVAPSAAHWSCRMLTRVVSSYFEVAGAVACSMHLCIIDVSMKLDTFVGINHLQEPGPDLIGLLVSNGGFATAVHARQLHTAAAIAVHLLKVSHWADSTYMQRLMLLIIGLALSIWLDANRNRQHSSGVSMVCRIHRWMQHKHVGWHAGTF